MTNHYHRLTFKNKKSDFEKKITSQYVLPLADSLPSGAMKVNTLNPNLFSTDLADDAKQALHPLSSPFLSLTCRALLFPVLLHEPNS